MESVHVCILMCIVSLYLYIYMLLWLFILFRSRKEVIWYCRPLSSLSPSTLLTLYCTLTQLFLRGPFFHKGDSLEDSPEHHTEGEDVCLGCVGQSAPHLWSHVEVRATGGGEVLPGQITVHQTFTHLAQTKVCHLEVGQGN